jgi:hypothetical protein
VWSYKLFRIGALVLTVLGVAHLLYFVAGKDVKPLNGTEFQIEQLMYGYRSNIMGAMRTQGEIFDGMSLGFAVFMFTLAAIGFTSPVRRKTAVVIAVSLTVMLGISLTYWFIMPTSFLAAALLCFAGSAYLEK